MDRSHAKSVFRHRPGMVVTAESYVCRHGGHEGVKPEDQVLITITGCKQLSTYPPDAKLLGLAG